jgi:hypothetical protein
MRPKAPAADGRPSGSSLQAVEQVDELSYRAGGELNERNVRVCYNHIVLIINQAKTFTR